MMKVRFEPLHGQDYVATPDVGGGFTAGQVRELPDEDAAYLMTNRNFVDDATDANPLYVCEECGADVEHYVFDSEVGLRLPDRCVKHRDTAPAAIPGSELPAVTQGESAPVAFDVAHVAEPITPEREE